MNIELSEFVALVGRLNSGGQPLGFSAESSFWIVGQHYFIRTATYHQTGRLVKIEGPELIFDNAAWIADSGRFTDAMKSGEFSEVEVWPDDRRVLINRSSVIDATQLPSGSPRSQK